MGYAHTIQALIKNVDEDDKKKMGELGKLSDSSLDANAQNSFFINESGAYSLILRSEKPEATPFRFGSDDKTKMEGLGGVSLRDSWPLMDLLGLYFWYL